jgi:hypothetical protein
MAKKAKTKTDKISKEHAEYLKLNGHSAIVTGGKVLDEGTKVKVKRVNLEGKYGPFAVIEEKGGKERNFNIKFLKADKPLSAADKAKFKIEQEAMVVLPGVIRAEREKAVAIQPDGHFKWMWIGKTLINETEDDGVYEVPLWWARRNLGEKGAAGLDIAE